MAKMHWFNISIELHQRKYKKKSKMLCHRQFDTILDWKTNQNFLICNGNLTDAEWCPIIQLQSYTSNATTLYKTCKFSLLSAVNNLIFFWFSFNTHRNLLPSVLFKIDWEIDALYDSRHQTGTSGYIALRINGTKMQAKCFPFDENRKNRNDISKWHEIDSRANWKLCSCVVL